MGEPIDRESVIDIFKEFKRRGIEAVSTECIIEILFIAPTIEAEPVKHGRWETVHDNNGVHQVCPYCGEWRYHNKQLYCGNCGVRMDEV